MQTTTTTYSGGSPPYDKTVALVGSIALAWFFGFHGFHRFYVGEIGLGIAQCITCGGCCIWSIIDWINMEHIVDEANRRAGWTNQVVVQQTTQPTIMVATPTYAPGTVVTPGVVYSPQPQGYAPPPQGYQPGYPPQ